MKNYYIKRNLQDRQSAVMDKLTRASEMKPKHSALASELPKKPSVDAATAL